LNKMAQVEKLRCKSDNLEAWVSTYEDIVYLHIQQKPEAADIDRQRRRVSLNLDSVDKLEHLLVHDMMGDETLARTTIQIKGLYECYFERDAESTCWLKFGKPQFK
jgi:hypothetical protein